MRLIVVRHGETLFNAQGRFTGQLDIPLSALGKQQAEALGHRLSPERIDVIAASDLRRARDTAQAIARHHGLPVVADTDLREIAFGAWEGRAYAEVVAQDAALVERWQADPMTAAPPGGETLTQLHSRGVRALERRYRRSPKSTVVWTVHGGVIEVLLCHLLRMDLPRRWEFRHENAALTEIVFEGPAAVVVRLNETHHLFGQQECIPES